MQVVVHLLLQGISVSFLVQWRFLTNNMNWVALHFCPIRGCNSHHIHVFMDSDMHYWLTFGRYLCANIHVILEVWVHKGSNLTLEKVGVGINPATDVTHFGFYFSCVVSVIHLATILNYEAESQLSLRWIMHQNVLLRMKIMLYFHQRILDLIYPDACIYTVTAEAHWNVYMFRLECMCLFSLKAKLSAVFTHASL